MLSAKGIFDFSSETTERNSTKLKRKQDLNVLYQFCVFRADQKNEMDASTSDWLKKFWLLLRNRWTEFKLTWRLARCQRPLQILCFSCRSKKSKMASPASDWLRHFQLCLWNHWMDSMKLDKKQDPNVLFQDCVLRANQLTKMAVLADPSKRWHMVLRCTMCGPLGLLFS